MATTSFRNKTLWVSRKLGVSLLTPQKQPLTPCHSFILLPHMCVGPNYMWYCLACFKCIRAVLFSVFYCNLLSLFNVVFVRFIHVDVLALVHSFELLCSISLHADTIIYLPLSGGMHLQSISHRRCCHQCFYLCFASQIFALIALILFCSFLYRK